MTRRIRPRMMPRPRVVLAGAACALAGMAVLVAVNANTGSGSGVPVAPVVAHPSGPAADFHLAALQGRGIVDLAGAEGRPVVLSFFASWCEGCRTELSTMAALARSGGAKVQVIGIDVNDDSGPARTLLARDHIAYPVGVDADGQTASHYGLIGLPTTVFLDGAHRLIGRVVGPLGSASGVAWLAAVQAPAA